MDMPPYDFDTEDKPDFVENQLPKRLKRKRRIEPLCIKRSISLPPENDEYIHNLVVKLTKKNKRTVSYSTVLSIIIDEHEQANS